MKTRHEKRGVFGGLAFLLAVVSQASFPSGQLALGFDEVVRISGTSGSGTGTVIHKEYSADHTMLTMCVLTADHVVHDSALGTISFGWKSVGDPGAFSISPGSGITSLARFDRDSLVAGADMAVMKMDIPISSLGIIPMTTLDGITARNVVAAPAATGYTIKERGFGVTGVPAIDGTGTQVGYFYDPAAPLNAYGKMRFYSNKIITHFAHFGYSFVGGGGSYDMEAMKYLLDPPVGAPDYVADEGYAMPGDSGSGILNSSGDVIGVMDAVDMVDAVDPGGHPGKFVGWGYGGFSLKMNDAYIDAIESVCGAVPEPGTLVALAAGLAAFAVRRRSRR